jgi:hypothetical protein
MTMPTSSPDFVLAPAAASLAASQPQFTARHVPLVVQHAEGGGEGEWEASRRRTHLDNGHPAFAFAFVARARPRELHPRFACEGSCRATSRELRPLSLSVLQMESRRTTTALPLAAWPVWRSRSCGLAPCKGCRRTRLDVQERTNERRFSFAKGSLAGTAPWSR